MGCQYRQENQCRITAASCPWAYWCDKHGIWRENDDAIKSCQLSKRKDAGVPDGYCAVEFERHGKLYVRTDTNTVTPIKNPYDIIPQFVKVRRYASGYKVIGRWTGANGD